MTGLLVSLALAAGVLAALVVGWDTFPSGQIGRWPFVLLFGAVAGTSLVGAGLAGVLLLRARESALGRFLAVISGFLTQFWTGAFLLVETSPAGALPEPSQNAFFALIVVIVCSPWVTLGGAMQLSAHLATRAGVDVHGAPRKGRVIVHLGKLASEPESAWWFAAIGLAGTLVGLGGPMPLDAATEPVFPLGWLFPVVGLVSLAAFMVGTRLAVKTLRSAFEAGNAELRDRILWIRFGFSAAFWLLCVAVALSLVELVADLPLPGFATALLITVPLLLAPLAILLGLVLGVFWSGAANPALALSRSKLLGILTAFGVVVFSGVENLIESYVARWLPFSGIATVLASGAITALLVFPLQRRLTGAGVARDGPESDTGSTDPGGARAAHKP